VAANKTNTIAKLFDDAPSTNIVILRSINIFNDSIKVIHFHRKVILYVSDLLD
jgi:hypothetical protein